MTVLDCILFQHDVRLVLLAVIVCGIGSWVTSRLFLRSADTVGPQRTGWLFLASVAAGVAIWCTHFIAMLGFEVGVPVSFDPVLTITSMLIAVGGSTLGFVVAGSGFGRAMPAIGGAIVGLAIATMHYTGMLAYRVDGLVSWDRPYLVASIALSVGLSAIALHLGMRRARHGVDVMAGVLGIAIASLHFTGMAAFRVEPLLVPASFSNPEGWRALALAIASMSVVVVATGLVSYLIDDSTRAETLERLRRMALSDPLTGLPNRASFGDRLDFELALAGSRGRKVALVGIDLNRFKEINDLRGHGAGDEVLRVLGRRLRGVCDDDEFVARVGGDEFAAICRFSKREEVETFIARLHGALFTPVRVDDCEMSPGASFGVAVYPDDAADKTALVDNADLALYRAKADLGRAVCFYEAGMDEAARARRLLAADLREALTRRELSLHYQVQTSVQSGDIRGFEALLRWERPGRGYIAPSDFVPLAEETGLILEIGEWVLRTACTAAANWEPPYKVAVNVSPVQFAHTDLARLVATILEETGLAPERLELELTETAIFADRERSLHTLEAIKALGVGIALDDFGTGYSSLETLRSFPFDKIKLDRSFTSDLESNAQARAIIRAVLALGKSLGIPVLAEGIETKSQLGLLGTEGCDEAQGFFLGRPASLSQLVGRGQIAVTRDGVVPITGQRAGALVVGAAQQPDDPSDFAPPRTAQSAG